MKRQWLVKLQNFATWTIFTIICFFGLDDKFSCVWIDAYDLIGTIGCLKANLATGDVAAETVI